VTLDQAIQELKIRSRTNSMRLPNLREVNEMESFLGITFHPDYVRVLLKASDVDVGFFEPATITEPSYHTHLPAVIARARHYGVPENLLPFCDDSTDFYC
jgi:SMI1-KNR4 cell-wall